jgi:Lysine-specific metallo-endopeptidase
VLQRSPDGSKSDSKKGGDEVEVHLAYQGKCPHPEKIAEAIPGARSMLAAAENWFINYPFLDPGQQQFFDSIMQAHFGTSSSAARGKVHSRIIRMARTMDMAMNGGVTFDCGTGSHNKCNEGPYSAFVSRKEKNIIHICPDFFKAGLEERRFMMIHESGHMAGAHVDHYLVQAGPIGKAECLNPSGLDPSEALENAESYAWAVMCLTRKDTFTFMPGVDVEVKKKK